MARASAMRVGDPLDLRTDAGAIASKAHMHNILRDGERAAAEGAAHRTLSRLRAGGVHVNTCGDADISVPLGGHGMSGNGHDKSPHMMDRFRTLTAAWINP